MTRYSRVGGLGATEMRKRCWGGYDEYYSLRFQIDQTLTGEGGNGMKYDTERGCLRRRTKVKG